MDQWMMIELGCYMALGQAVLSPSGRFDRKVYMLKFFLSAPLHWCSEQ